MVCQSQLVRGIQHVYKPMPPTAVLVHPLKFLTVLNLLSLHQRRPLHYPAPATLRFLEYSRPFRM